MDVHESPRMPLRHHQKQQLSSSLANQYLKKRSTLLEEDGHHYETIRKKIHTNEQNDSVYFAQTVKKHNQGHEAEKASDKLHHTQKPFYAEMISAIPLRQKYAQLVPELQGQEYTLQQKMLLRIQNRLDEHLLYLKIHRGKKKGEFFKSLRKNLIQGSQIIMEIYHLKQMLFIDNSLYICNREVGKDSAYDILIDLPTTEIAHRKADFREKFQKYIRSQQRRRICVSIPLYKFPFQEEIENNNHLICLRRSQELAEFQQQEEKQETERVCNINNFFNEKILFRTKLYHAIQQRQAKQRERLSKKQWKFGTKQIEKVLDQIFLIYNSKKIRNMFKDNLIKLISDSLLILDEVITQILDFIINMEGDFLKIVSNSKGIIIQVDINQYKSFRDKVLEVKFQK